MHNLRWTLTKTMLSCSLVVCSAVPVVLLSSMLRWDRHRPCCAVCFLSIALALHGRFLMPVMVPRFFPPSSPTMLAPFSPPHTLPGSRWGGGDPTHNHTAQHNTTPRGVCVGGEGRNPIPQQPFRHRRSDTWLRHRSSFRPALSPSKRLLVLPWRLPLA